MSISTIIRELRYSSSLGFGVALAIHRSYIFAKYRTKTDQYYIKKRFKEVFGKELNLDNPETLNEKIQWYKIHFKNPLITKCADKYEVRKYISDVIGEKYLIPLLFQTQNYRDIVTEKLPDPPFIIKANHTAGTNYIVKDKKAMDWKKIQSDCRWWLHLNYYYIDKEWQYDKIKPRIVVEKLLTDAKGQVPSDYKLHFIDGIFQFLQVDLDRFTNHKRNIYDKDWNLLPFTWSELDKQNNPIWDNGDDVERPKNLELLISLGEKLAKPFPYVRVDFYILNNEIYFGELTFHHGGGYEHFTPNEWDLYYGKKVPLVHFPSMQS